MTVAEILKKIIGIKIGSSSEQKSEPPDFSDPEWGSFLTPESVAESPTGPQGVQGSQGYNQMFPPIGIQGYQGYQGFMGALNPQGYGAQGPYPASPAFPAFLQVSGGLTEVQINARKPGEKVLIQGFGLLVWDGTAWRLEDGKKKAGDAASTPIGELGNRTISS